MLQDAFGGDVHANFQEVRTSGGALGKKDKPAASQKDTLTHYFGLNLSFLPRAL